MPHDDSAQHGVDENGIPDVPKTDSDCLSVAYANGAKTAIDLIAPLKCYVTHRSRAGDRHICGAKSRCLTRELMACVDPVAWGEAGTEGVPAGGGRNVDVAGNLRKFWSWEFRLRHAGACSAQARNLSAACGNPARGRIF
jgi:hypothetical protein